MNVCILYLFNKGESKSSIKPLFVDDVELSLTIFCPILRSYERVEMTEAIVDEGNGLGEYVTMALFL